MNTREVPEPGPGGIKKDFFRRVVEDCFTNYLEAHVGGKKLAEKK